MATRDPIVDRLVVVFIGLRLAAVVGLPALRYVDSIEYEDLDLGGRAKRPWTVPLLFEFVESDTARVLSHAVLAAGSWSVLAVVVGGSIADRRIRLAATGLVLATGLTTAVTNWDTTVLSDSTSLSLTVLGIAVWWRFARQPSLLGGGLVVVVTVLWTFVRLDHLVVTALTALAAGAFAVARRGAGSDVRRLYAVTAAALVLVTVWGQWSYSRNRELQDFNLALNVALRVVPDIERWDWFVDHGMPQPEGIVAGQPVGGAPAEALLADDDFAEWVHDEGLETFARYLLTHPWYAATGPLRDMLGATPPQFEHEGPIVTASLLSPAEVYGPSRPVLPPLVEDLVWPAGNGGVVLVVLVGVGVWLVATWRRDGFDGRWGVQLATLGIAAAFTWVVWHGSPIEIGRHNLDGAVMIRIALIGLGATLFDRRSASHSDGPMRATKRQRRSGQQRPAWPGNAE